MLPENYDFNELIIDNCNDLSILDDQYTVSYFNHVIQTKKRLSDSVITKLNDALFASNIIEELKKALKDEYELVVNLSSDLKKAIEDGIIKLDKNKAGELFAQVRKANGQLSKKLSVGKKLIDKNIDIMGISNALQMKAIEQKMEKMLVVMTSINESVTEIIHGQQNDRLGLYYSGVNMYLESKEMKDNNLKNLLIAQSLKSLSDSNAQMIQSIQSNVQYLIDKNYKSKKGNSSLEINNRMNEINKSFETIFKSTVMKASIYFERNEFPAMITTLDEYGKFLNRVIIPIAPKLAEFDINDIYLKDGIWESRSNSLMELDELKRKLFNVNQLQISEKDHIYA